MELLHIGHVPFRPESGYAVSSFGRLGQAYPGDLCQSTTLVHTMGTTELSTHSPQGEAIVSQGAAR